MTGSRVPARFEALVGSHRKLLGRLFQKASSPEKTELLASGFSDFFRETLLNDSSDHAEAEVAGSFVSALVDCLASSNYREVAVAARILRDFVNSVCEIPADLTPKLISALDTNVPSSAYQIAVTLGCIGCSKPDKEVLKEVGVIEIHDIDFRLCRNCTGGFGRTRSAKFVVPSLVANLHRPLRKDRNREVRRACAIALGEIAYTNPDAVLNALQPLRTAIKDVHARDAVIFALGCVGYTEPDLIADFIPEIKKACASGHSEIFMACRSAMKKIGMETNCLVDRAKNGRRELQEVITVFLGRMKHYDGTLAGESVLAIRDLARKFPEEIINALNGKLDEGNAGRLDENMCVALDLIAQESPEWRKKIAPIFVRNLDGRVVGYGVIEASARALSRMFEMDPELVPRNLESVLVLFLKYRQDGSARESVEHLLEVVRKHKT